MGLAQKVPSGNFRLVYAPSRNLLTTYLQCHASKGVNIASERQSRLELVVYIHWEKFWCSEAHRASNCGRDKARAFELCFDKRETKVHEARNATVIDEHVSASEVSVDDTIRVDCIIVSKNIILNSIEICSRYARPAAMSQGWAKESQYYFTRDYKMKANQLQAMAVCQFVFFQKSVQISVLHPGRNHAGQWIGIFDGTKQWYDIIVIELLPHRNLSAQSQIHSVPVGSCGAAGSQILHRHLEIQHNVRNESLARFLIKEYTHRTGPCAHIQLPLPYSSKSTSC